MTFTEAAVEVLRSVGKPLHYKKITEIAIEKNLLSHVGKTPETTMSSRLATMVKKDRGDAPIIKVKPGVFALRDSDELGEEEAEAAAPESDAPEAPQAEAEAEASNDSDAPEAAEATEAEPSIAAQELPGADVFPEEDDDDELALEPYIESARCTSCDECIQINSKIFEYNADKKAFIKNPDGGPYRDLVKAAEKCTAEIIHPGLPRDRSEKDIEKWIKRAEKFN